MTLANISIYGLVYLLGAILLFIINRFKSKLSILDSLFISVYCALFVIISGRLGYILFYEPDYYLNHLIEIVQFHKGGMAFHGAIFGLIICSFIFFKKSAFFILDNCSIAALIALPIGRICNFLNGEVYGRITDFKYAVIFLGVDNNPRFPSQLFEAIYEGPVIAFILFILYKLNLLKNPGLTCGYFSLLYSIGRFFIEFTREADLSVGYLMFNLTLGQYLCLAQFFISIIYLKMHRVLFDNKVHF